MMIKKDLKIIFWGTAEFALPSLEALLQHGYRIVAVVTNPDEPAGRKQVLTPPPVKVWAEKQGIPVFQPSSLTNYQLPTTHYRPDLFIIAVYGKIIPKEILEIPKHGALNIHPSLLPRWRGPSPIQYAIFEGDHETGVTIIAMDEKMDHGPVLESRKWKVESRITAPKLSRQLSKLAAELLIDTLPRWIGGEIKPQPQDESKATYSKILKKEDGKIDWRKSALEIERMIRAFTPWPGSYTFWQRGQKSIRLEMEAAEVTGEDLKAASPGFVWQTEKPFFFVQCGKGSIRPLRIRPASKKSLATEEFLHGYKDIIGAELS